MVASVLPSLARLRLDARPTAPTAEFHALTPKEVKDQKGEHEDGEEPLTEKPWRVGQGIMSDDATFRLKIGNTDKYRYYDARALWEWVSRRLQAGDPPVDPGDMISVISSADVQRLAMRYEHEGRRYYDGESGAERLVRLELPDGVVQHYEGPSGAQWLVRIKYPDGVVAHYEGGMDVERIVRLDFPGRKVQYYKGKRGKERIERIVQANGPVQYYQGEKDVERLERIEVPDGRVQHYEGESGAERRVRTELPDGTVKYYEGERGAERLARVLLPNGDTEYYAGKRGKERLMSTERRKRGARRAK